MNILYINLFLRSFSKVKFPDVEFLGPSADMLKAVDTHCVPLYLSKCSTVH